MFQGAMSNSTLSEEVVANNLSSFNPLLLQNTTSNSNNNSNNNNNNNNNNNIISSSHEQPPLPKKVKKRRNLPGNPDPDAEVIALSPKSLLATNRFICEICNKGFQRDQNLQLHRRGHNLPWKLKQRNKQEIVRKKAYVCPEPSCVHHHPSRALGDLTGIKKHFCRKHGEKKFKCEKCSKIYAVHSDWKAHSKTCGTREYRCDCGTLFSRKDSFITHRAFCDALAEESARLSTNPFSNPIFPPPPQQPMPPPSSPFSALSATQHPSSLFPFPSSSISLSTSPWDPPPQNPNNNHSNNHLIHIKTEINNHPFPPPQQQPPQQQPPQSYFQPPPLFTKSMLTSPSFTSDTNTITAHFLSATALLQKATAVGATLQQSQQSQHAQAQAMQPMLNHGFDELGPSFCNVGQQQQQQQPPSTTTTTTTNVSNIDYHHHLTMGMVGSGDFKFATWRKDEDTTRDFLGLTAGDHYTPNNNTNTNTNTTTTNNNIRDHSNGGGGGGSGGGGGRSEGGFVINDDDDDMEGNMLKFTGGLQYGMTASYDRDNSSPSSSSLVNHHHHHHHHGEGSFGNFVTSQPPTAAATSDSRWG